ncbi:unnamed protein product [Hydatigera taeniaeformis]|uniref:Anaphase-promoting complex subunit 5 n=1 Tax=Hydatigena taeniaeformis TaxID=6205 RepID=A0A3P7FYN3_HYDTA|nr:unnamed protein product [Hydatigera taeniaeformis]
MLDCSAYGLLSGLTPIGYDHLTVKAHYFLSSWRQGKFDHSLCEEFRTLPAHSSAGSGIYTATAFAHFFKGNLEAAKQSLQKAYQAAGIKATSGDLCCVTPALLHAMFPLEAGELWEESIPPPMDPLRRLVIAESLHAKSPLLTLHHLNAFLSHPSYGYEYILFQFHNSSTAEGVRHLLDVSKTWALLRPDLEPVWTLLAATLRLYSGLQGVKKKTKTAAREGAVTSLFSAFAVCSPSPTSEVFGEIIVCLFIELYCCKGDFGMS